MTVRLPLLAAALLSLSVVASLQGHASAPPQAPSAAAADATTRIVASAQAVLGVLDDAGRRKIQFAFDDAQQRKKST